EYNVAQLRSYGFRHTAVVPILVDAAAMATPADPAMVTALRGTGTRWLFVGRLAPNKCQQDIIKAFALYRRVYDPAACLWLVGGSSSDAYAAALASFAADAGVGDAVVFTGSISPEELTARYQAADLFVCLSEHEGFLVPLLEAWHHRLPVIAYAAAAVPETLGRGGVLLSDKTPGTVAAAAARVTSDPALNSGLVAAGQARLDDFSLARTSGRLLALADELASGRYDRLSIAAR
ncbi:MAG TPA: glycosyltransferase family 4 protein, partial [Acidimicrobiales bacterium]|nr:glycosyltransferase family 4 protein [Acidimicrobiales bacterium]